ncbi:MAG TPA: anti-sigma factor, partial [Burkholderiales bacterium]|nr:anti-sigma factor [Burkholderiales bacterium]
MSETGQAVSESDLQAWADGRLPAGRRADVEAWLAANPDEAERLSAYRALTEQLRAQFGAVLEEPVPERLVQFARRGARWRNAAAIAGWIAIGAAVGGAAG